MKKEIIDSITGILTDFRGLQHHITIVAVSAPAEIESIDKEKSILEVSAFTDNVGLDFYDDLFRVVHIGISVCHPEDVYTESVGFKKALARAKANLPILYASKPGVINKKLIKALLTQELEFAINNPETIIPGYNEAEKKYLENKENERLFNNLDEEERTTLEYLLKASSSKISKLMKLIEFKKNHG